MTAEDGGESPFDRAGMYGHIESLGSELRKAWLASEPLRLPPGQFTSVVVAGMGGSAAGGDYLAALAAPVSRIPVHVVRGYALPRYAGEGCLAVVVSYSGKTREALACYRTAREQGAATVVVTSGGPLAQMAAADGTVCWPIAYDSPPRASLAHTLAPLLRIGNFVGATDVTDGEVCAAADRHTATLERIGVRAGQANPGRELARAVAGRWPVLFSAEHLRAVTRRTRNQLAENSKVLASVEPMPEAAHNFVVGFEHSPHLANVAPIAFTSPLYSADISRGFEVLEEVCRRSGLPFRRVEASGQSLLADLLEITAWGDCLSYYLAEHEGLDPTPTKTLDFIKSRMGQGASGRD